jgi:hypothetical protein
LGRALRRLVQIRAVNSTVFLFADFCGQHILFQKEAQLQIGIDGSNRI